MTAKLEQVDKEEGDGVRALQPTFRALDFRPPFLLRLASVFID
jgi:hypothetical protein